VDNRAVTYQPSQYGDIITRHILNKHGTQWHIAKINHALFFQQGKMPGEKMLDTGGRDEYNHLRQEHFLVLHKVVVEVGDKPV